MTGEVTRVINLSELAEWLQNEMTPDYFAEVVYDSQPSGISGVDVQKVSCYDSDGNLVLLLQSNFSNNTYSNALINFYISESGTHYTLSFTNLFNNVTAAGTGMLLCGCPNGFFLSSFVVLANGTQSAYFHALFTKSSDDKYVMITPATIGSTSIQGPLRHLCWGEVGSAEYYTSFYWESPSNSTSIPAESPTQLVNFLTNPGQGVTRYCPYAFYIPSMQGRNSNTNNVNSRDIHMITLNGEYYITNWYWALKCYPDE